MDVIIVESNRVLSNYTLVLFNYSIDGFVFVLSDIIVVLCSILLLLFLKLKCVEIALNALNSLEIQIF